MSFDFLAAVKNVAPILAGTFGTPLAGLAVKAICGFIPDAQAAEVQAAETANPGTGALGKLAEQFQAGAINIVQIKQAELQHAKDMAELGYKNVADLEALANADRASARDRDAGITKAGKHNWRADALAYLAIAAMAFAGYALFFLQIPQNNREMLAGLIGALTMIVKDIYGFEFSTTRDSQGKTETISEIAKAP